MTEFICEYCGKKCRPSGKTIENFCFTCDYHGSSIVEFQINRESSVLVKKTFECFVNDLLYAATFDYSNNKFYIERVKKSRYATKIKQKIVEVDELPDISPETAQNKIKVYLIFS